MAEEKGKLNKESGRWMGRGSEQCMQFPIWNWLSPGFDLRCKSKMKQALIAHKIKILYHSGLNKYLCWQ